MSHPRNFHSVLFGLTILAATVVVADTSLAYDATISVTPATVTLAGNFSEAQLQVASLTSGGLVDKRSSDLTTVADTRRPMKTCRRFIVRSFAGGWQREGDSHGHAWRSVAVRRGHRQWT